MAAVDKIEEKRKPEDFVGHRNRTPSTKIPTLIDTIRIIGGSCFLIKTQYNKIVRAYSQIIMKGKGASNEKMYIINVCACYFCVPCFGWV